MIDSIAEITHYIIMHAKDKNLHETISHITNPSYRKCILKKAYEAGNDTYVTDGFEDWYKENFE
jgi:hypothetical protein